MSRTTGTAAASLGRILQEDRKDKCRASQPKKDLTSLTSPLPTKLKQATMVALFEVSVHVPELTYSL